MLTTEQIMSMDYRCATDEAIRFARVVEAAILAEQGKLAEQAKAEPVAWHEGFPPFPQDQEWFIAETSYGDRVVLRALPEEYSYDYKTADDTYFKKEKVVRWMQFPDCEYLPPAKPHPAPAPEGMVMVPKDPTEAMIVGFWGEITKGEPERAAAREAWRAAIAAAEKEYG